MIVAHRITTIASCDTILYLEKGEEGSRLVEMGSHASLMARGGKYADFVKQLNKEAAFQALPVQTLPVVPERTVPALLVPKRPQEMKRCTVAGVLDLVKHGLFGEEERCAGGRFFPLFLRFSIGTCRNCPFVRAFY